MNAASVHTVYCICRLSSYIRKRKAVKVLLLFAVFLLGMIHQSFFNIYHSGWFQVFVLFISE